MEFKSLLVWPACFLWVSVAFAQTRHTAASAAAESGTRSIVVGDTLTIEEALAMARAANPSLLAARLRANASQARISQVGALPDPQLAFGLMNRPLSDFGTAEPMTMNVLEVVQVFPWPGRLAFGKQQAEHLAEAERLRAADAEWGLVARVRSVYYELGYMDRALAIMKDTRELLRDFYRVSTAMYTVGSGLQQDVLQAQVSVAQMTEDITVMEQQRVAMSARLNALMGRGATVSIGALKLPAPAHEPLPKVGSLIAQAAGQRPALREARERALAADAGYRQARRKLYPDLVLSFVYGQRPQFDDMLTLMVGLRVPIWAGSRQLPMRDEMAAMQAMQEARAVDIYNETFAELTELAAEAERARSLSQLYASSVIPQAEAAVESALSAYRVGRVDYMTLVMNEMTVNRYRIESVRLAAEYQSALAQIEALLGAELGGAR